MTFDDLARFVSEAVVKLNGERRSLSLQPLRTSARSEARAAFAAVERPDYTAGEIESEVRMLFREFDLAEAEIAAELQRWCEAEVVERERLDRLADRAEQEPRIDATGWTDEQHLKFLRSRSDPL